MWLYINSFFFFCRCSPQSFCLHIYFPERHSREQRAMLTELNKTLCEFFSTSLFHSWFLLFFASLSSYLFFPSVLSFCEAHFPFSFLYVYLFIYPYVCVPVCRSISIYIHLSILLFFLHFHSLSCLLFHSPFLLISFPSSSPLHSIRLIHSLHLHFPFTVCLKTYSIYIRMRMGSHRPTRGFEFISRNWYKLIQIYMHTSVYLSLCSYRQTAMCKGILNWICIYIQRLYVTSYTDENIFIEMHANWKCNQKHPLRLSILHKTDMQIGSWAAWQERQGRGAAGRPCAKLVWQLP